MKKNFKEFLFDLFCGVAGSLLILMIGFKWNTPIAAWVTYPLLLRFFRRQNRWFKTLPVVLLVIVIRIFGMHGGWDMDFTAEIGLGILINTPLIAALYFDRYLAGRVNPSISTLVFPVVYTSLDFLSMFTPVGTILSPVFETVG